MRQLIAKRFFSAGEVVEKMPGFTNFANVAKTRSALAERTICLAFYSDGSIECGAGALPLNDIKIGVAERERSAEANMREVFPGNVDVAPAAAEPAPIAEVTTTSEGV